MLEPVRVLPGHAVLELNADPHLNEEWLLTNGLGGYASGTVSGALTACWWRRCLTRAAGR